MATGVALVNDAPHNNRVKLEHVLVGECLHVGVLLNVESAGEVVEHLALRTLGSGSQRPSFLKFPDLFESERVAFDGR